MFIRIVRGKLKPKTWDEFERAYKDVVTKVGKVPGLRGRWLARDVEDPAAGYSISIWENEAAMRAYVEGDVLKKTVQPKLEPFFAGEYTATHCELRHSDEFK